VRRSLICTLFALHCLPAAGLAQSLQRRLDGLLDAAPFDRALWGVIVTDSAGRVLYARNADRLFVPASNTKLVVTAAASAFLGPDFRIETSVYGTGPVEDGTLQGDLVVYGRGDPTFSTRCYGPDTLALGACETASDRLGALADSVRARGIRHVAGSLVGDGSYFDDDLFHGDWDLYDINWWYAAPVSGLGFNDNSVDLTWGPGPTVGAPAAVSIAPDVGLVRFENRTATGDSATRTTVDYHRAPGTWDVWADGMVAANRAPTTEYFAVPDPSLFFAAAFRAALARHGVSIAGRTWSTTDSLRYRASREEPALVTVAGRLRDDILFPILNTSQNWFAEMLLKTLGRRVGGSGSWRAGLQVERQFLVDSVKADSGGFNLSDGSGLSSGNLIAPRTFAALLRYMWSHPQRSGFLRGLPRSGQPGSLRTRFVGTALEGRVVAKTGSISHVNSLSGFIERPTRGPLIFSVIVNNHTVGGRRVLQQIDSVVVAMAR
jgi:D-alanyl-D-alanine carboxypeptidase/D-alanyl-D-alanine-endopeptidase (penicillin-binding protein 4)